MSDTKYRAVYEDETAGEEGHQDFDCKNDAIVFLCWMGAELTGWCPLIVVEMPETAERGGIVVYNYA